MSQDQRFRELALEDIEGFVARRETETLHLEFKSVLDEDLTQPGSRKILAELLAGFANADGGLVVWGVDARRVDKIDCAQELKPLRQPEVFSSRVHSLVPDATTPIVDGVETRVIAYPDGRGFAATFIPASDGGPHMAKFGEDRYMRRCEDRMVRMEHYEVADMFGRRRRPVLAVEHSVAFDGRQMVTREAWEWRFRLTVGLSNSGRGVALAPYLALHVAAGRAQLSPYGLTGNGENGLPRLASAGLPGWTAFGGSMYTVVHPGTRCDVTAFSLSAPVDEEALEDVLIDYRATADGIPLREGHLCMTKAELRAALPSSELPESK